MTSNATCRATPLSHYHEHARIQDKAFSMGMDHERDLLFTVDDHVIYNSRLTPEQRPWQGSRKEATRRVVNSLRKQKYIQVKVSLKQGVNHAH